MQLSKCVFDFLRVMFLYGGSSSCDLLIQGCALERMIMLYNPKDHTWSNGLCFLSHAQSQNKDLLPSGSEQHEVLLFENI